ncbi:MAG: hypothetical protein HC905_26220 [Bacteroidales bacterium]|nr:hypothetical protein [Bacteroidales bacterium]
MKTALLQETPWVLNAKSESQRKRNIALLFDLNRMASEMVNAQEKIRKAQLENGGFSWFPGLPEDRYITQYIVAGMGHLEAMGIKTMQSTELKDMIQRAVSYMDMKMNASYQSLIIHARNKEIKQDEKHLDVYEIQYLYARSFFRIFPLKKLIRRLIATGSTKQSDTGLPKVYIPRVLLRWL